LGGEGRGDEVGRRVKKGRREEEEFKRRREEVEMKRRRNWGKKDAAFSPLKLLFNSSS